MKISRVLRNFLLGYSVLHIALAGVFLWVLSGWVRDQMLNQTRLRMQELGYSLKQHMQEQPQGIHNQSNLDFIESLAKDTGARYTLITDDGTVVADSRTGRRELESHKLRPEVRQARQEGIGFNERTSTTVGQRMMYCAVALDQNNSGETDFVRVAVESESIRQAIGSLQKFLWIFSLGLFALAGGLMIVFAAREMRPLQEFAGVAREIAKGNYEAIPSTAKSAHEWQSLSEAFELMKSELLQRENTLKENSLRQEAVLASMIEGVLAIDSEQQVLLINQAAAEILGTSAKTLMGNKLYEVFRVPELTTAVTTALADQVAMKTEFTTLSSPRKIVRARITPLTEHAQFGAAIVVYDVTELRNLETMRRDFVANVSHELKTPLSAIKASAETLRLGALYDENNNMAFVEQIESQAEVLNNQIGDLLWLSRVESGQASFEFSDIEINAELEDCLQRLETEADSREIQLIHNQSQQSLWARTDREALQTVLKNLVSNGIHYSKEGGSVTLSARQTAGKIEITVQDNGIGIAPEHQSRVFERFYRVDKARSRDVGGTGLGLAIVKHTVQAIGGSIRLESRVGHGSRFIVELPAKDGSTVD